MANVKHDELQKAAKRHMDEPPTFTREDGSSVDPDEVPDDTRKRLESARRGYLKHIADKSDVAKRMSEAISKEDRKEVANLAKEARLPKEMTFRVDAISSNWFCECSGCLFGFCCKCRLGD
jgi:hypothetical protein